jgi:hypothetical protein
MQIVGLASHTRGSNARCCHPSVRNNAVQQPHALCDKGREFRCKHLNEAGSSLVHRGAAPEIGEALKRFVDKDEKTSLHDAFDNILEATQKAALEDLVEAGEVGHQAAGAGPRGAKDAPDEEEEHRRIVDAVHAAGKRLQAEVEARLAGESLSERTLRASTAGTAAVDRERAPHACYTCMTALRTRAGLR